MANILSLAVRVTGDASGLQLTPVERALKRLQDESDKTAAIFDKFATASEGGARAQQKFADDSAALLQALKDGQINAQQYAEQFDALTASAKTLAATFEEGAKVTEANRTAEERRAATLERLNQLLQAGAIDETTFSRATAEASGANAEAARIAKQLADTQAEGARVAESVRTQEERRAVELERLDKLLQANAISEETYSRAVAEASGANAEALRQRQEAEKQAADAIRQRQEIEDEGQRIADSFLTTEERNAKTIERLNELRRLGAIGSETYSRAYAEASGANAEAARQQAEAEKQAAESTRQRQALQSRATSIIQSTLTVEERYAQQIAELNTLRTSGLLTQDQYNRAVAAARKPLNDAAAASQRAAKAASDASLKFNELSGVFAVLPGPLGNIAGRLSGLSSAGEGLSRIFSGGLTQGFSGIASSVSSLVNPLTAALAGVTAFAAGASSVARGLVDLEARVESLGRLADQLGVSFEFVQVLEEAGQRADVSIEQLSGSFARLQNTLSGTDEESKKAGESLGRLGVSVQDFGRLSEQQRIELIGERLAAIEDPAKRSAAAIGLFGKSGVQLLPFFKELDGAATDIERFGRSITDLDRERLDALGGGLDQLGVAAKGLGVSLILPFTELGESVARALADAISGVSAIVDPLARALQPLLSALGQAAQGLGVLINLGGRLIGAVVEPLARLVEFVSPATAAASQTTTAIEKVRESASKPADARVFREIQDEARRTSKLLADSAKDVGIAAQSSAYAALTRSIRLAREEFDRSTPKGAEQYRQAVERANNAYERQIDLIKQANDAQEQRVKSQQDLVNRLLEQQRIEQQFGGDSQRAQSAENFQALNAEIQRLRSQLDSADIAFNESAKNELNARIRNLEQLRRIEQDITSGDAQRRSAAQEKELERAKQVAAERERVEKEAIGRVAEQRQTINEFVNNQLALQQFDGDSRRLQAQQNVLAIEQEMRRVQQDSAEARFRGDLEGVRLAVQRLSQLDQVAAKERDIASGRAAAEEELAKQRDESLKRQQAAAEQFAKAQQEQARKATEAQQKQVQAFSSFLDSNTQENARALERNRELATASSQTAQGADIRTAEGARAFIQALQGGFDPQYAVALQQLKVQQRIATGIDLNLRALNFQTFSFPAAAGG